MDSTLVTTIITGTVTIIGAIVVGIVTIIRAIHETKKAVDVVKDTNIRQDAKLDNITILVNGRYTEVLKELASLRQIIATTSGLKRDQDKADAARALADDQSSRESQG